MSTSPHLQQLDLFATVGAAFASSPDRLTNDALYEHVARQGIVDLARKEKIGVARAEHNPGKRAVRWVQQTLKHLGLAERIPSERGVWRLTAAGKTRLTPVPHGRVLIACSTDLGIALWARHEDVFRGLSDTVHAIITSPPFPLAKPRAYGGPKLEDYTDFICRALEPLVKALVPGGSIALHLGNSLFTSGLPSRTLYRENVLLELCRRFGLHSMDTLVWANPSQPPGPVQWASIERTQLNTGWDPILWLTNDPSRVRSDNRRVLQPHTAKHLKLLAGGGEPRSREYGDGSWRLREGKSFSNQTAGRIPRNVLQFSHVCAHKNRMAREARAVGAPIHGATMPQALAEFLIRFLTAPGELVADPFGGWLTTAAAAEALGRRWITTEMMLEYAVIGARRITEAW